MNNTVRVKIDYMFIKILLVAYERPETVDRVQELIEMHRVEAIDAKDPILLSLSVEDIINMLDNAQGLEILSNARKLGA